MTEPRDKPNLPPRGGNDDDRLLAGFFEAARDDNAAGLPPGLRARLIDDALSMQPAAAPIQPLQQPLPQPMPRPGPRLALQRALERIARLGRRLGGVAGDLGGMPGLATMGVAAIGGVWIGLATPEPASRVLGSVWQGAAVVSPALGDLAGTVDASPLEYDGFLALMEGL